MKIDIQQKMQIKIQEEYGLGESNARSMAEEALKKCPVSLLPNVYEWAEGRTLSDIFVGQYSIPMIMSIWKSKDFLRALRVITELLQGDTDKAERQIWQMRR